MKIALLRYWKMWDGAHWRMGTASLARAYEHQSIYPAPRMWRGVNEEMK